MDQGLDKSKLLSTSYRETFRRHRKLLCLPIVLGALAAGVFLFAGGKTYKSTASLWVDTAATAPSSVGDGGSSPLGEPPAAAEQAVLGELLTTRAFTAAVAQRSLLGKSLGSAAVRAGAAEQLGNGQVMTAVPGAQVLQVSYSGSSPAMAESVLGAVISQLRDYTKRLSSERDQAAVAYQREQVNLAQAALATARRDVTGYQEQHRGVSQTDPRYVSLVAAQKVAAKQLAAAHAALSQATRTGNGGGGGWSMRVIDSPSRARTAPLRKSKMAKVIFGGVLAGLLVSFLAVVALTPAKKEAWEDELPIGAPLSPDGPPADPSAAAMHSWLSLDDRVSIRTRAAPTEER